MYDIIKESNGEKETIERVATALEAEYAQEQYQEQYGIDCSIEIDWVC